jgi:autotransporter translocation and assembly factor TamB
MPFKKRGPLWLAGALGALALAAWSVDHSGLLAGRFRGQIEARLSALSGRPVRIAAVEGGLFGSLTLRQVGLAPAAGSPGLGLSVGKVVVRFSPWQLLRDSRHPEAALREVDLVGPMLDLPLRPASAGQAASETPSAAASWRRIPWSEIPVLPAAVLKVSDGSLRVFDPGDTLAGAAPRALLTSFSGLMRVDPQGRASLSFAATSPGSPRDNLHLDASLDRQSRLGRLRLEFKGISLAEAMRMLLPNERRFAIADGSAEGWVQSVTAPEAPGQLVRGMRLEALLKVEGGQMAVGPHQSLLRSVQGSVHLNESHVRLEGLNLVFGGSHWSLAGSLDMDRRGAAGMPVMDLRGSCPDLALAQMGRDFGLPESLGLKGALAASLRARGPWDQAQAELQLKGQSAGIAGFEISSPALLLSYQPGALTLQGLAAQVDGGELRASGSIDLRGASQGRTPTAQLNAELVHYPLGVYLARQSFRGVSGTVGGSFELHGPLSSLLASFRLNCQRLTLGSEAVENASFEGRLGPNSMEGELAGSWRRIRQPAFRFNLHRDGQGWVAKDLRLEQGGALLARASGRLSPAPDMALDMPGADLGGLPLEGTPCEGWHGQVSGKGRLQGTWEQPQLALSLRGHGLKTRHGHALELKGQGRLDGKAWQVESLDLGDGQVALKAGGDLGSGAWQAQADLDEADLPLLADLAPALPAARSGQLSGSLQASRDKDGISAELSLSGTAVSWGGFSARELALQAEDAHGRIKVRSLTASQDAGGRLEGDAELEWDRPDGALSASLTATDWDWQGHTLSAQASAAGHRGLGGASHWWMPAPQDPDSLQALVELKGLSWDRRELGSASAQARLLKGERLELADLHLGPRINGSGWWQWAGGKPQGLLDLRLADFKAQAWMAIRSALPLSATAGLAQGFSGSIHAEGGPMGLTLLASLEQGSTGHLELKAAMARVEGKAWRQWPLSARLETRRVAMADLARLALGQGAGADWDGRLDLEADAQGSLDKPQAAARLYWGSPVMEGFAFDALALTLSAQAREGKVASASLRDAGGSWALSDAAWRWKDGALSLEGHALAKDAVAGVIFTLNGDAALKASLEPAKGRARLRLDCGELKVNQMPYPGSHVEARWEKGKLKVAGAERGDPFSPGPGVHLEMDAHEHGVSFHDTLALTKAGGSLRYTADISSQGALTLDFDGSAYPAADIARVLGLPLAWDGATYGHVSVRREAGHPPKVTATLKIEDGSINRIPFDLCSGTILVQDAWLSFDPYNMPLSLVKRGRYTATLRGRLPLGDDAPGAKPRACDLDLAMDKGDLVFLRFIDGVEDASGPTDLKLHIGGPLASPKVSGRISVQHGVLVPTVLAERLEDVSARIFISDNQVDIYQMEGQAGAPGQRLYITRGPLGQPAVVLREFVPDQLNLKVASGKAGVRLAGRPALKLVEGTVAPNLLIQGTMDHPRLKGSLDLEDCVLTYPPVVADASGATHAAQGDDLFHRTDFSLELKAGRNVWYESDFASVQLAGQGPAPVLKGPGSSLGVQGTLRAQRGEIDYLNSSFTIDDSQENWAEFRGDAPPFIEVHAYQVFRNIAILNDPIAKDRRINMYARGPLGQVQVTFDSEPPMSQTQIASLLGFGEDVTAWSGGGSDVQRGVMLLLGKAISGTSSRMVRKQIKRYIPVDSFQFSLGSGVNSDVPQAQLAGSHAVTGADGTVVGATGVTGEATGSGSLENPLIGSKFDVGKALTDKVYLNWHGDVGQNESKQPDLASNQVGMEYQLQNNKKITMSYDFAQQSGTNGGAQAKIEGYSQFGNYKPARRPSPTPFILRRTPSPTPPALSPTPLAASQALSPTALATASAASPEAGHP